MNIKHIKNNFNKMMMLQYEVDELNEKVITDMYNLVGKIVIWDKEPDKLFTVHKAYRDCTVDILDKDSLFVSVDVEELELL